MAVGADHEIPRADDPLLREQRMLDAHAAHLVEMRDALIMSEIAHDLRLLGALDVLVGHVMIRDEDHLILVEHGIRYLRARPNGKGSRHIIGKDQVQIAFDELPRLYLIQASMSCQYLLRHGHGTRHGSSLLRCTYMYMSWRDSITRTMSALFRE